MKAYTFTVIDGQTIGTMTSKKYGITFMLSKKRKVKRAIDDNGNKFTKKKVIKKIERDLKKQAIDQAR